MAAELNPIGAQERNLYRREKEEIPRPHVGKRPSVERALTEVLQPKEVYQAMKFMLGYATSGRRFLPREFVKLDASVQKQIGDGLLLKAKEFGGLKFVVIDSDKKINGVSVPKEIKLIFTNGVNEKDSDWAMYPRDLAQTGGAVA